MRAGFSVLLLAFSLCEELSPCAVRMKVLLQHCKNATPCYIFFSCFSRPNCSTITASFRPKNSPSPASKLKTKPPQTHLLGEVKDIELLIMKGCISSSPCLPVTLYTPTHTLAHPHKKRLFCVEVFARTHLSVVQVPTWWNSRWTHFEILF